MPAIPYHTHQFSIPTASTADIEAGISTTQVITPAELRPLLEQIGDGLGNFGASAAGGTANALTISADPSIASYTTGMMFAFRAASDNTGPATFNVNGIGAKPFRFFSPIGELALTGGEIKAGSVYMVGYVATLDGGNGAFVVMNPTDRPNTHHVDVEWFGVVPTTDFASPIYCDTQLDTAVAYAVAIGAGVVKFPPGIICLREPHIWPRQLAYEGSGYIPNYRALVIGSMYNTLVDSFNATTLLACGTGSKDEEVYYVTEGTQLGFDHVNANRLYTNARDARFVVADFTNQDASGETPATPRAFSAFIGFEEGFERINMKGIRVMPSCPDDDLGEVEGVGGYKRADVIKPWADWDVGVYVTNPWQLMFIDCTIVGYWNICGHFSYGAFKDPDHNASVGGTPNGEHGMYQNCMIQGLCIRTGGIWPVIDKTSDDIYVRWTESHQFNPAGGLLGRVTEERDSYGGAFYEYSGTQWVAATPNAMTDILGGGFIRLLNVRPQGAGANDTSLIFTEFANPGTCSKITFTPAGGHSHTRFIECAITDFGHCTGVDEASDDFLPTTPVGDEYYIPGRYRYTPGMDLSGAPMRALKFSNCLFSTVGPNVIHIGMARDVLFDGDCYAETRPYKLALTDTTLNGVRGGAFFMGANTTFASEAGTGAGSWGIYFGHGFNTVVSMHPIRFTRAGTRMELQLNTINALGWIDYDQIFPRASGNDLIIGAYPGKPIRLSRRNATTGALELQVHARDVSSIARLELLGNVIITKDTSMNPTSGSSIALGSASTLYTNVWGTQINGLEYRIGSGSVVIDTNRIFIARSYTVATLPTSVTGGIIRVSDGTSNKRLATGDAGVWKWPDGATVS